MKPRVLIERPERSCHATFRVRIGKTADNAYARRSGMEHLRYLRSKLTADGFSSKIPAMANGKPKLELTWIGKENRPKLEPRVLIEDPAKSYHAAHRVGENDLFDNRLIFGDNLLALKALEQEFTGKVKCIYIDPPYNAEQALNEYYDDSIEHSQWLSLMRDRFQILRTFLACDGTLFCQLNDDELAYAKVVLDEVFGRNNFLNQVSVKMKRNRSRVKIRQKSKK